ncbi:aspartate/glutamate racemase family protein [Pseudacidovorax intermedius]|uniref:aspartate/glutamate racemase family protein n=1 Tax=Pseudacidovorax intermedius TaxID=433924 RepID=UPI0026EA608F|nr:aspartate/glutamate racemase family protein [Pseudacidovorax intermedius]
MKLLLINPNRTQAVTDAVLAAARTAARPGTELLAVTGRQGPAIIASRAENALAQQEVLELAAQHAAEVDAIVLGVSLDSALWGCRELFDVPVVGMTEAGLLMGATLAGRIGVLTYGARMAPLYRELVEQHGLAARLAGIETLEVTPQQTFETPLRVQEAVLAGIERLVVRDGAEAVLLAGAAMASMAPVLQPRASVPLLDGVACAVALAQARVDLALPAARAGSLAPLRGRDVTGVTPALAARFRGAAA